MVDTSSGTLPTRDVVCVERSRGVIYIYATAFGGCNGVPFTLDAPRDWRSQIVAALDALRAALGSFWVEPPAPRRAAPVPAKLRDWQAAAKGLR